MPLVTFAKKAASWGYEGIEVACGAHLDPVKAAKSKKYCKEFLDTLKVNNLNLYAISNHLAGQLVCDPDDDFSMIEGTLDHEQWDAFKPQLPAGRLTNIRYGQTYDDPRRMILVKQGISNGLMDILTFRRRGGNWKLVSYEN